MRVLRQTYGPSSLAMLQAGHIRDTYHSHSQYCCQVELLCPNLGNQKMGILSGPSAVDREKQASLENYSFHLQTYRQSELFSYVYFSTMVLRSPEQLAQR